jgi:putative transposase
MPWQELSPMNLRMRFVTEWQSGCWTMTDLCTDYRISRKTGYKWIDRYAVSGPRGLHDRARRPHHSPRATDAAVVDALVAVRKRHPRWGAKKLLAVAARRDPHTAWPSRSTVCDLLKARGLVGVRRRRGPRRPRTAPLGPITAVNQAWTTDFKGEFRTGDGVYCYPLTLRDGFSRFVLRCDALAGYTFAATRRGFERAFAAYGLPERIRSDNGVPFASSGVTGLSRLSVWWIRLGIIPERIAPGHPEQNGSHEQFHAVLKAETARPPAATRPAQQRRFDRFCAEYNQERPHEALDSRVPASVYHSSPRPFPSCLPPLEYAGHLEVRRIFGNGCFCWGGRVLFLSDALIGQDVAFEEVDDGLWTIWYTSLAIARFDERQRRIHPIAPFTRGRLAAAAREQPCPRDRRQAPVGSSSKTWKLR